VDGLDAYSHTEELADAGDVNGDGLGDILYGQDESDEWHVYLFLAPHGGVRGLSDYDRKLVGMTEEDGFFAPIGDVDDDGLDDLLISVHGYSSFDQGGVVHLVPGASLF